MALSRTQRLEQLRKASADAREAQKEADTAHALVRKQVAAALKNGVEATEIASTINVSRQRVYALKDRTQRPT